MSFPLILLPLNFYQIVHYFLNIFGFLGIHIFYFIDKFIMILFQAFSIWILCISLNITKELKMESCFIISLILHLMGFTIILFISF